MTIDMIRERLRGEEYAFLRSNEHLNKNIILLGLGGSHAYGTAVEGSDIDIRGCALNSPCEILLGEDFEQVCHIPTDTVVYSFNKLINLLTGCNPNTIELLGLKEEQYIYLSDTGRKLIGNRKLFLSKQAVFTFGGYADDQLRRLDNKSARSADKSIMEEHILRSLKRMTANEFGLDDCQLSLYTDTSEKPDFEREIFIDIDLKHYPVRDLESVLSKLGTIIRDYSKTGKRNRKAIAHGKLSKHMMHLIRLYMMCSDILEKEEIITCREKEHSLLMDIRNGKYLDDEGQPVPEFYELVDEYKRRCDYAAENTSLPEKPDIKRIREFKAAVNEKIIREN
ncbi:MAG: nucleotidyltransferase domain-containing protein [Oscillospiraceae bacterium]|nr:nucleotidyltransferase domain-containing protein [Oscillospiraceae bacterium]